MPRGKKEPAEQIIPNAASVEVEVGRGKTVANGGQEDRCDGADVLHGHLRIDRGQAAPATCSFAGVCRIISAATTLLFERWRQHSASRRGGQNHWRHSWGQVTSASPD